VLQQEGLVDAWSDENLHAGDDWPQEIRNALDRADIAILIVSTNLLSSRFIMEKEMPALLDRKKAGTLKKILPLVVTPCAWQLNRYLKGIEIRPKHRDSLASGTDVQQDADLTDFTVEVARLLTEPKPGPPGIVVPPPVNPPPSGGSRDAAPSENVYAILEIKLRHREWEHYSVELNLTHSDKATDPPRPLTHLVSLDLPRLAAMDDVERFATELRGLLFPEPAHRALVSAARKCALKLEVPLRVRLTIGACARELHWLRWELLTHGNREQNDLSSEDTCLIRYAGADLQNRRKIQQRPQGRLTAFLAAGLTGWLDSSIPPAGVQNAAMGELRRVGAILESHGIEVLEIAGYLITEALKATLRTRAPDILYLCIDLSGSRAAPPSVECNGSASWPPSSENLPLAETLKGLEQLPRIVILSPVLRDATPEVPLSPMVWLPVLREAYELSQVGVIGTLTTQGPLEPILWDRCLDTFFHNLNLYGRLDYAIRTARHAIKPSDCHWIPVLVSCLRTARIWYVPRFMEETRTEPTWETLLAKIKAGGCTPILGPGLNSMVARARTKIALGMAESHRYPMAFYERDSLPQVAQYVASVFKEDFFYVKFEARLREIVLRRFGAFLAPDERKLPLSQLLSKVAAIVLGSDDDEPHNILASLPFPLYVTASLNSFLTEALRRVPGKEPQETVLGLAEPSGAHRGTEPSPEHPMVYHLFGNLNDIYNSVITEDNYFDFLIHYWKEKDAIPTVVRATLNDSSLLFLGFKMHHWDFRVLFRTLLAQEGGNQRKRHMHVAVQVDPDNDQILDPERARSYLENYFSRFTKADIYVYCGSAQDFLRELKRRWDSLGG
jgi:hypothetical protein